MHVTIGIMDCGNIINLITDDYANMKTDALNVLIEQVQDAMDNPDYGWLLIMTLGMFYFPDGLDENGFPFYYDELHHAFNMNKTESTNNHI